MQPIYSYDKEDQNQRAFLAFSMRGGSGFLLTDRGGRQENQDAWAVGEAGDGSWVFVLADGLGGHAGGRLAAQLALRGALEAAKNEDFSLKNEQSILGLVESAHRAVIKGLEEDPGFKRMRSAILIVLYKAGLVRWAHVGDVRFYLVRGQDIPRRTLDHSVPQMLVNVGEISPEEIRGHPDRGRLLQALGQPEKPLNPAFSEMESLENGDFLVAATDGFWEWIDDEALVRLALTPDPQQAMVKAEAELKYMALQTDQEYDNYSALFFFQQEDRAGEPEEPAETSERGGVMKKIFGLIKGNQ